MNEAVTSSSHGIEFIAASINWNDLEYAGIYEYRNDIASSATFSNGVTLHFKKTNDLISSCEQHGIDIAPLLERRERAFYELEEAKLRADTHQQREHLK